MNPAFYQIKITLRDSHPAIWRRIQVSSAITLRAFHRVLQEVMGWDNAHSYVLIINKQLYAKPDPECGFNIKNDSKFRLGQVITDKGQCFVYEYDPGDSWQHYCVVEATLPFEDNKPVALCVAGARACPPEDAGGIPGYEDFLASAGYKNHQRHKEMIDWAGGAFDPAAFDLNVINKRLQRLIRRPSR
ncbi:MAG: plasmid pRiA4b ORF-3 family protein [Elusimicrobia bacterium]|nr:plasmid pRiA4b ORF-3 family protein [Elusimicrobiota bacterium]